MDQFVRSFRCIGVDWGIVDLFENLKPKDLDDLQGKWDYHIDCYEFERGWLFEDLSAGQKGNEASGHVGELEGVEKISNISKSVEVFHGV